MCPATLLTDPFLAGPDDVVAAGKAAAAAGFTDASAWTLHLDTLTEAGLHAVVLEAATAWPTSDADAVATEADELARLVEQHGSSVVLAVCLQPSIDADLARRNLAALADRVAPLGAQVCVEFFPPSAIGDLASAWHLIEPLGSRVGLVIDTFHWHRQAGGPALDVLASIPGERIGFVQVADAAAEPASAYEEEALAGRLLPGDGVVDFATLFGALDDIDADPFVATEIFSTALVSELGPFDAAVAMRDATRGVLS